MLEWSNDILTRAAVDGTPSQIPAFLPITFTLESRSHKMLLSTFYIMWPMHLWSLKLLCPVVKEEMHLQENTLYDLDLVVKVTQNVVQCPPNHILCTCKIWSCYVKQFRRRWIYKKVHFMTWPSGQGHTKCCPVPSTSCDLCTWELWSCYVQWFRRRCIYKKIHYLTSTPRSRSHEVLPSTFDIMRPMHRQNLKLLLPKVYEGMRLQENTLFDLWPWTWGQGHTKRHPVPLKSCDLCTGKIWSCYFQKFMRRCIYKKIHYLTLTLGSRSHEMSPSTLYIMWSMHLQSLKLLRPTV